MKKKRRNHQRNQSSLSKKQDKGILNISPRLRPSITDKVKKVGEDASNIYLSLKNLYDSTKEPSKEEDSNIVLPNPNKLYRHSSKISVSGVGRHSMVSNILSNTDINQTIYDMEEGVISDSLVALKRIKSLEIPIQKPLPKQSDHRKLIGVIFGCIGVIFGDIGLVLKINAKYFIYRSLTVIHFENTYPAQP